MYLYPIPFRGIRGSVLIKSYRCIRCVRFVGYVGYYGGFTFVHCRLRNCELVTQVDQLWLQPLLSEKAVPFYLCSGSLRTNFHI